jgi:phage terminase large subunit GpA-like protein
MTTPATGGPTIASPAILKRLVGYERTLEVERESRRRYYAPPPDLTCSEWADRFRMLSRESSAEPGRWRTDRRPYLREIMDACSDPRVERVTFQKPAQIGWTEVIGNVVGYYIDLDPSPILVIQPTVDLAKMWSKERFDPMLRDSPRMWGKISEGTRREKDQSILRKAFPGGFIAITGANSAAGLRARPVRILIGDERDAYPVSARGAARPGTGTHAVGEGDPFSLGIKRTTTFWNRKILEGSTPTIRGQSQIEEARGQGSDAAWYVACPHCSYAQTLKWGNLRWESGRPETAAYTCGLISEEGELLAGCGERIEEYHLPAMNAAGVWVHTHPERTRWRSYMVSGLVCVPWADLAREWIAAHGKPEELKVFVNTRLAETWNDAGEEVDESELEARREDYGTDAEGRDIEIPMGVGALFASVDVQDDRLEYLVRGYGAGAESWFGKHEQLWGDPSKPEVWRSLDLALFRPWRHASGATLQPRWTFIDSGGHHAQEVYAYCKARRSRHVYASKGTDELAGRAAVSRPSKNNKGRVLLFTLGTVAIKDTLFARLKTTTAGPGYLHYSRRTTSEFLRQVTSERRVTRYSKGRPHHAYEPKPGVRNEGLDLEAMAWAGVIASGLEDHLGKLAGGLAEHVPPAAPADDTPAPAPAPRRTGYMSWRPSR